MSLQRFLIAITIPKQTAHPLLTLQSKHNLPPWEPKIDLHITLVSPFSTSETVKALAVRLASIAGKTKPFTISVHGFGRFDNAESIFYAKVTPNSELTKLADNTLKAVIDLRRPRSHQQFTPHITLAAPTNRSTIDQYFAQSTLDTPQLSFLCNHFSLLLLDERGRRWHILKKFLFKNMQRKASPR